MTMKHGEVSQGEDHHPNYDLEKWMKVMGTILKMRPWEVGKG